MDKFMEIRNEKNINFLVCCDGIYRQLINNTAMNFNRYKIKKFQFFNTICAITCQVIILESSKQMRPVHPEPAFINEIFVTITKFVNENY